jgi:hypothetical protein
MATDSSPEHGFDISQVVNLAAYPIDRPGSDEYQQAVASARRGLEEDNCACLKQFIAATCLPRLVDEATAVMHEAVYRPQTHNPYFSKTPDGVPANDPRAYRGQRTNGMVPADALDHARLLWKLYRSAALMRFIEDCVETHPLHHYADPLGAMVLSVQQEGQQFEWHFDTNDFAVTILLQEPVAGGVFEYAPDIRSAEDENYEAVAAVLAGQSPRTKSLTIQAGDLQLFRGRHSVHRVTAVAGSRPRIMAVLAFTERPDVFATPERAQQAWGRVHPAQYAAAASAPRPDALLD